ncbi:hypothetical protein sS8_4771 [Methylocaldum marinum]|uniref:Uncharacterized protein n=1 Tax=Methylocaldum marinum TaxID=1432792 RepID=A0A250KYY1_9GAMM|nr:hypothetical protein sS8_4771 [Methylocaldum marinum]
MGEPVGVDRNLTGQIQRHRQSPGLRGNDANADELELRCTQPNEVFLIVIVFVGMTRFVSVHRLLLRVRGCPDGGGERQERQGERQGGEKRMAREPGSRTGGNPASKGGAFWAGFCARFKQAG